MERKDIGQQFVISFWCRSESKGFIKDILCYYKIDSEVQFNEESSMLLLSQSRPPH